MLVRIIKMTFKPEHTNQFQDTFSERKHLIAGFEGCNKVELMRDITNPNIFFTISEWQSEQHLNLYRHSVLFNETWSMVKKWFNDVPVAHSLEIL